LEEVLTNKENMQQEQLTMKLKNIEEEILFLY